MIIFLFGICKAGIYLPASISGKNSERDGVILQPPSPVMRNTLLVFTAARSSAVRRARVDSSEVRWGSAVPSAAAPRSVGQLAPGAAASPRVRGCRRGSSCCGSSPRRRPESVLQRGILRFDKAAPAAAGDCDPRPTAPPQSTAGPSPLRTPRPPITALGPSGYRSRGACSIE